MPKLITSMKADDNAVIRFDGIPWLELPVTELLACSTVTPKPRNIEIVNVARSVSLSNVLDHTGRPVIFEARLIVTRSAKDAVEETMIEETAQAQVARKEQRETKEANMRQAHITELRLNTRESLIEGLTLAQKAAPPKSLAEQITEAAQIINVVGKLAPRALTSGE